MQLYSSIKPTLGIHYRTLMGKKKTSKRDFVFYNPYTQDHRECNSYMQWS